DMALIRIAYAADLPAPEDALKAMDVGGAGPTDRPGPGRSRVPPAGGGGASVAHATHPAAQPRVQAANGPPEPARFEDVVRMAEDRRDIALKLDLERHARPISFRPGAIVFEPAPGAPANLATRLAARLKEWTGQPWLVAAEGGGGGETLAERERREAGASLAEALAEPFVQAVMEAFPGTEIVAIRRMDAEPIAAAPEESVTDEDA
ncbi:MAG: DNA polymerase III subunit gamma/tau, partial [Caulobacteraceae bacterium]|nr:DNA polymerase III subunit gamma/tau [Caulobacteraceae bacterium]